MKLNNMDINLMKIAIGQLKEIENKESASLANFPIRLFEVLIADYLDETGPKKFVPRASMNQMILNRFANTAKQLAEIIVGNKNQGE